MSTVVVMKVLKKPLFWMAIITVAAGILFTCRINQESIWNDEWFTVHNISRPDLKSCVKEIEFSENNPPLYYFVLRWWAENGTKLDMVRLRLFSALCAVLTVIGVYYLASLLFGNKTGVVAGLLCATSPYIIWYAQEARNSIVEALLGVGCMIFFFRFCERNSNRDLIFAALFQVIGLFTHYFLLFLLPAQLIYVFFFCDRRKQIIWTVVVGIATALFVFWVPSLISQIKMARTSWLIAPTVYFPLQLLGSFSSGIFYESHQSTAIISMAIFFVMFLFGIAAWSMNRKAATVKLAFSRESAFVLIFFFVPLVLSYTISFVKPILYEGKRYLILILPLFFIIAGRGVLAVRKKTGIAGILTVILGLNLYYASYIYVKKQKREWDKACTLIHQLSFPGDILFSNDYTGGKILEYYGIGYARLIEIPDLRFYKKQMRHNKRVWFISIIDNTYEEQLFNSNLPRISTHTFICDEKLLIKVILYDCSML